MEPIIKTTQITIITLYVKGLSEYYVAAVEGELTEEQRLEFRAKRQGPDDEITFCQIDLVSKVEEKMKFTNICDLSLDHKL